MIMRLADTFAGTMDEMPVRSEVRGGGERNGLHGRCKMRIEESLCMFVLGERRIQQ